MIKMLRLPEFQRAISNYAKAINQAPVKIAKKLGLNVVSVVVPLTRVDTGRARAGWMASYGTQPSFDTNPYNDGVSRKEKASAIERETIAKGTKKITSFTGGILWIANNVDYIEHLEAGTARCGGDFMLQAAIDSTTARAEQLTREALA